jgi:hypothetical protein
MAPIYLPTAFTALPMLSRVVRMLVSLTVEPMTIALSRHS